MSAPPDAGPGAGHARPQAAREPRTVTAEAVHRCERKARAAARRPLREWSAEARERIAKSVSEAAAWIGTTTDDSALGPLEGDLKGLVKHLPAAQEKLRSLYLVCQDMGATPQDNPHLDGLMQIDRVERDVRALLDRYGGRKPQTYEWHDLARHIAVLANAAWRRDDLVPPVTTYRDDDGADEPRRRRVLMSVDSAGPLCAFVQAILLELGIAWSDDAVSAALRGRRGRNRK